MIRDNECKVQEEISDLKKLEQDISEIKKQSDDLTTFAGEIREIVTDGQICQLGKCEEKCSPEPKTKQNRFIEARDVIDSIRTNMKSVLANLEAIKKLVE